MQKNLNKLAYLYLLEGDVMQLATVHEGQPWVCNLYYAHYNSRIYWLSFPSRRHSQDIAKNNHVAATFMVKSQRPVIGVQIAGNAHVVSEPTTIQDVMSVYVEKYNEGSMFYENFTKGTNKHCMYELTPTEIVLFDEVNFPGDGRQQVT